MMHERFTIKAKYFVFDHQTDNGVVKVKAVLDEAFDAFQVYGSHAHAFISDDLKRCFTGREFIVSIKRALSYMSSVIIDEHYDGSVDVVKNRYGANHISKEQFKKEWSKSILEMQNAIETGQRKPIIVDFSTLKHGMQFLHKSYDAALEDAIVSGQEIQDLTL